MNLDNRKGLLGFSFGFALFVLLEKFVLSKTAPTNDHKSHIAVVPTASDEEIKIAVGAYSEALAAQEPTSVLNDLNAEFAAQYNIQVFQQGDGQIIVTDLAGNEIAKMAA
jgi:hypothetical protein